MIKAASFPERPLLVTLLFIGLYNFSTGQTLGFHFEKNKKKATIPIQKVNNLIVVTVLMNNWMPLKLILDTGVRTTILTKKEYGDLLGLTYSKKYELRGLGEKKMVRAYVADNVSLNMPGIRGVGHSVLALEEDYLNLPNHLGIQVHGILGYELFSRFIVKIDYQREKLTLMRADKFKKKKRYQTIPLSVEDTKPYITVWLQFENGEEKPVKLLVDTGASSGLLISPQARDSIMPPSKEIRGIIGSGLNGEIIGSIKKIPEVRIGKHEIKNPLVYLPDTSSYAYSTLDQNEIHPKQGSIGGEILSRFIVILNFAKGALYLKKKTAYSSNSNYDMSGLTIQAHGPKLHKYKVTHIVGSSPGDRAGIKAGDEIISINGILAEKLTLSNLNAILRSRAGKKVGLYIKRGDTQLRISFRLEDLIDHNIIN